MRRVVSVIIIALALATVVAGCARLPMESNLDKTISMTSMKGTYVRQFDTKERAIWLFWGLAPLSVPSVDEVVGPHVADRAGIQNLSIETRYSIVDGLITTLTIGILTVRTVRIKGEVYDKSAPGDL